MMLAGLVFAIEEAEDRPGMLAATLPFGGMTLLEYQIRLLAGAGVEQVLVAVGRMTPPLLNAVNRATRRGVAVEVVRSAEEAADKLAPDARVLVIADGLVTTDPVMDRMAAEGPEALLVTDDAGSPAAIERIDMRDSWAGIARLTGAQLGEIARMPSDYDFQSALLRVAVQAGAEHINLTAGWLKGGHSVELSGAALSSRSNAVLAALTERRTTWADRWVFTRIARLVLPELTGRNVPAWSVLTAGTVLGFGALGTIAAGWEGVRHRGRALLPRLAGDFRGVCGAHRCREACKPDRTGHRHIVRAGCDQPGRGRTNHHRQLDPGRARAGRSRVPGARGARAGSPPPLVGKSLGASAVAGGARAGGIRGGRACRNSDLRLRHTRERG